jgi:4-hydroxybenzoate polyprenyltransferase
MIKLSHSVFALPFALMAAFLAGRNIAGLGRPSWGQLGLVLACMVAARSVAMTFNRIADRDIDARNPRTRNRPLQTGRLTPAAAWVFLAVAASLFVLGCAGFWFFYANRWPLWLCVPVLLYLCGYSYTKRFTRYSHFYLGSAIAFSPVAAWLAVHPESVGVEALVLMGAVTLWIAGFDIIYACQDLAVDREQGLFSLPARIGPGAALWVARGCHATAVLLLLLLGRLGHLGVVYYAGVALVAVLLIVENGLVRADDLSRVNVAFFTMNGIVSLVMGALTVTDILIA